ncbi:MAG: pilin, partial [bacterium]
MNKLAVLPAGQIVSPTGYSVQNLTGFGDLLNNIFALIVVGAGIMLIAYLLFGAFKYMTAGGDDKAVGQAKAMMSNAGVGMVILVAAFLVTQILGLVVSNDESKFLTLTFQGPAGTLPEQYGILQSPFTAFRTADTTSKLISSMVGLFTILAGLGLLVYMAFGGFMYITSGGDSKSTDKAKGMMTNA